MMILTKASAGAEHRTKAETPRAGRRIEVARVVDEIDALCSAFGVGSRIPAHRDLMTRFGTTERTVLSALTELQRRGRINRRAGSGTYVATSESVYDNTAGVDTPPVPLRNGRLSSIVVIGSHDHGYYSRAIEMAFHYAQQQNLDITYEPPNFERLSAMTRRDTGAALGYLVLGSQNLHRARELHNGNLRIVGVGDRLLADRIPFPCVFPDNLSGGYLAASHLIDHGHKRIGYLAAGDNPRLWGHEQAVNQARAAGLDVQSTTIGRETFEGWQRDPSLGKAFFADADCPTGVCAWNDTDAIRLMTFLMSIGLRVPDDVSIVGYDNLPVSQSISPALTTVEIHLDNQVQLALGLLVSEGDAPHHSIVVDPELVVRQSTRPRAQQWS